MRIAVLDIGGTYIKSALCEDGKLSLFQETPTPLDRGGDGIMECAKKIFHGYKGMDAIGISTAGQVDTEKGRIRHANENIPGYTGTPVREILEEAFLVPVAVDNDVNMAAIGEAYLGAGRCQRDFLCLTYGTGIGGAIIQDKKIYRGSAGSAAEFGSIVTHGERQKGSGRFPAGIYEKYASTTALVRNVSVKNPELKNGKMIFSHLENPDVRGIVDEWIGEILLGLSSLIHIFNPSCVVLGGGVMEQPYILEEIQRRIHDYVMPSFLNVKLKRAELGNRAGLLGAAVSAEGLIESGKR